MGGCCFVLRILAQSCKVIIKYTRDTFRLKKKPQTMMKVQMKKKNVSPENGVSLHQMYFFSATTGEFSVAFPKVGSQGISESRLHWVQSYSAPYPSH